MILIFLKWFDVDNQRLVGQRPIYINRHFKTNCLVPIVSEMMGWHAEGGEPPVQIAMYEEIKPGMIDALKPNYTFSNCEIGDGDIIVFMRPPTQKRYPPPNLSLGSGC
jgi:ubiquitin carboxyl-terminal hydrolase 7